MWRIIYHPVAIVIFTGIAILLCVSLYINSREIRQAGKLITSLQSDVEKTSEDVKVGQQKLADAQSSYTKEKIIRDQLLMQKPGEFVVQIPDVIMQSEEQPTVKKTKTPWQQWQEVLGLTSSSQD